METATINRTVFISLGALLEYPTQGYLRRVLLIGRELRRDHPQAAQLLESFVDDVRDWSLEKTQETYTRAFDISPQCIPYISVYLFGEDNFKRATLMAGLKERYGAAGIDLDGELPDHVGVILRSADVFDDDEWQELVCWCVPGPLKEMVRGLTRANNPYRHILEAVRLVFAESYPREFEL